MAESSQEIISLERQIKERIRTNRETQIRRLRIRDASVIIYAAMRTNAAWPDSHAPEMMKLAVKEAVELEDILDESFKELPNA